MPESCTPEWAELLDEVVDIWRVLADPRIDPRPGSPAAAELEAAKLQPGESGKWGEAPVREAYALAILNYEVALNHGAAIAVLIGERPSPVSASVLARALAEAASQAWWLLEPGIGYVKRVARATALRYRSAHEGEKAAEADGVPADGRQGYTETKAQVEGYARELGLGSPGVDRAKNWTVYVCDSERLPTARWRVEQLFKGIDLSSFYPIFSGYSHSELFTLLRDFEPLARGDLGMRYRSLVNEDTLKGVAAVASYALYPPGERLSEMFGLGDAISAQDSGRS